MPRSISMIWLASIQSIKVLIVLQLPIMSSFECDWEVLFQWSEEDKSRAYRKVPFDLPLPVNAACDGPASRTVFQQQLRHRDSLIVMEEIPTGAEVSQTERRLIHNTPIGRLHSTKDVVDALEGVLKVEQVRHLGTLVRDENPPTPLAASARLLAGRESLPGIHYGNLVTTCGQSFQGLQKGEANLQCATIMWSGAPTVWMVTPPRHSDVLEFRVQKHFQIQPRCSQFVRHENLIIPPSTLKAWGVDFTVFVQRPGEVVVTDHLAYYCLWRTDSSVSTTLHCCENDWGPSPMYAYCSEGDECGPGPFLSAETFSPASPNISMTEQAEEQQPEEIGPGKDSSRMDGELFIDQQFIDVQEQRFEYDEDVDVNREHSLFTSLDDHGFCFSHASPSSVHIQEPGSHEQLDDYEDSPQGLFVPSLGEHPRHGHLRLPSASAAAMVVAAETPHDESNHWDVEMGSESDGSAQGILTDAYGWHKPEEPLSSPEDLRLFGSLTTSRAISPENMDAITESVVQGESPVIQEPDFPLIIPAITSATSSDQSGYMTPPHSGTATRFRSRGSLVDEEAAEKIEQLINSALERESEIRWSSERTRYPGEILSAMNRFCPESTLATFRPGEWLNDGAIMETILCLVGDRNDIHVVDSHTLTSALRNGKREWIHHWSSPSLVLIPVFDDHHWYLICLDFQNMFIAVHDNGRKHPHIEAFIASLMPAEWMVVHRKVSRRRSSQSHGLRCY